MLNKQITLKLFKIKFQQHEIRFSLLHLIIFGLIFGLLGSYLLWRASAASPLVATKEAESMVLPAGASIIKDKNASARKAVKMTGNGTALRGSVSLPSESVFFNLRIRSSYCSVSWPNASVQIDGATVLKNTAIKKKRWANFTVKSSSAGGNHDLAIILKKTVGKTKKKRKNCNPVLYVDVTRFYGPETAPAPTLTFGASPEIITAGESANLAWESANADSCNASGAWDGSKSTAGNTSTGGLEATSIYNLTCTGSGGNASASVTVTVNQPPPKPVGYTPKYYVSPSGNDSNNGTSPSTPWQSISKVRSTCLQPGDVVAFEGGQIFGGTYLDAACSGTSSSPVVITSYGSGRAILTGGVWISGGRHDIVFDNLEMTNPTGNIFASCGSCSSNPAYNIKLQNSYLHDSPNLGISGPKGAHDWTIANNVVEHIGDSGILLQYIKDFTITKNTITDTGWNTSITYAKHGIYAKTPDVTISHNDFSNNQNGQAISVRAHGQHIYGNSIHDTPYAIAFFDYDLSPSPQGPSYIYSNKFWNISGYAFYYDDQLDPQGKPPSVDFVIANNTFLASGGEMFNLSRVPSSAKVTTANNIFTGSYGSAYRGCGTCSEYNNNWYGGSSNIPSGSGDLRVNPNLSAPPELALPNGSELIDKGTTSVPGLSYGLSNDRLPYYLGNAPDMGAFERQ